MLNFAGRESGKSVKYPRRNHFTPSKKGASLSYKPRANGVYGPELKELSAQHVYIMHIFVSGYKVLDLPIPKSQNVEYSIGSDGDDVFSLSGLSFSTGKSEPRSPTGVLGASAKRMKVEDENMEDSPPSKPSAVNSGTLDEEERVLFDLETRKKKAEGPDCFEVTMTSKMMFYIYKKPMKS